MPADDAVEEVFFAASAAAPQGRRVELIEGHIHVSPPANGEHEESISGVTEQIRDHCRDLRMYTGIGLLLPGADPKDRVIPDVVVAPRRSFQNDREWHDPGPVLLVVEVTSKSTAHNDRARKLRGYARAGIPSYVLVDREAGVAWVHTEPGSDDYARAAKAELGMKIMLPEPFGFELDTAEF
ncbi:Uma2 family endonuclease [Streptomyces sp. MAR4 CNX-425]|uniref:Uma2 family endonuclease n=1 Tax=Streptomyces sp. MAR4 CNX-425 TaxID=3406343 RepID=UPI003B503FA6